MGGNSVIVSSPTTRLRSMHGVGEGLGSEKGIELVKIENGGLSLTFSL